MGRFLQSFVLGIFISSSLFVFMSYLVSGGQGINKAQEGDNFIQFIRVKQKEEVRQRTRSLPKKPPEKQKPPPLQKMSLVAQKPQPPALKMNIPKIQTSLKGQGPALGGAGVGSSGVTPIIRIEPQYPRRASMQGLEGWVLLSFDITELGTVTNVRVLDSKPQRVFDGAARRALLKWKYRPKLEDGQPVGQTGQKVQLDFNLENEK